MKMKRLITIGLILIGFQSFCNVNFIQFDKIPNYKNYITNYEFLTENVGYYNHWTADWTFDISKKKLIKKLKNCYKEFSELENNNNLELNLLLGDISHYLYNLNEEEYFETAEEHYKKAIELAPNEFRTYWFIGNHYALSALSDKAIDSYYKAKELLPLNEPAEFWTDFTFATMTANMTSHSLYNMDKARKILGRPSYIEEQLGEVIRNRLVEVNKDTIYDFRDIWTYSEGDLLSFISRPLGIKILIDSTWNINFFNYKDYQSFIAIGPPGLKNSKGRNITYTIAIMFRIAQQGETLENFVEQFTSHYPVRKEIDFSDKYSDMIAMELENDTMYQDIGGAHMHFIGIERQNPKYPGLLLEKPMKLPESKGGKVSYYKVGNSQNRFNGTIFYGIMLDTCEDIYEDSYKLFKDLFENQFLIE